VVVDAYDTSKFTGVFTSDTPSVRIRKYMNEDGSEGSACYWWLRSADSNYGDFAGYVDGNGYDSHFIVNHYNAVLPVCLIQ